MCPPLTTCGGRLQRLFADWICVVCSVDGTSMCHYSAFAGMTNEAFAGMTNEAFAGMTNEAYAGLTNEAYAGLALPDVMPGLSRHPVDITSRRDTCN